MDVVTNEEGIDGDAIPERDQHNQDTNNVDMIDEEPNSDVDMFSDDENPNNGQNRRESELELAKVLAKQTKSCLKRDSQFLTRSKEVRGTMKERKGMQIRSWKVSVVRKCCPLSHKILFLFKTHCQ